MQNPVFQDLATQEAVMAQIASAIVSDQASNAIINDYNNDEAIRDVIINGG